MQNVFIFSKETLVFHRTALKQLFLYNTTLIHINCFGLLFDVLHIFEEYDCIFDNEK